MKTQDQVRIEGALRIIEDPSNPMDPGLRAQLVATLVGKYDDESRAHGPMGWLVWSNEHGAWWAPSSNGYVENVADAGRYTLANARQICEDAGTMKNHVGYAMPCEVVVPSPELMPALQDWSELLKIVARICRDATECKMEDGPSQVDGIDWDDITAARAAIAKATGQEAGK